MTSTKKAATMLDYETSLERVDQFNSSGTDPNKYYSMVGFRIKLKRHYLKYLINWYFPSLIFVLVSWMSFLIPPDVIPGRMALLITLLLVLINMFSTVLQLEPPSQVPSSKAPIQEPEGILASDWRLSCVKFCAGSKSVSKGMSL